MFHEKSQWSEMPMSIMSTDGAGKSSRVHTMSIVPPALWVNNGGNLRSHNGSHRRRHTFSSLDYCCVPCQATTSLPRNEGQAVRMQVGTRNQFCRFLDCWNVGSSESAPDDVAQRLVPRRATNTPFAGQSV